METVSSGIIAVSAGVSSTGLYFIQEGTLQVLNGGWAQEIGLAEGGQAFVSGGGILYVCTVSSGGTAAVLKGGYAQDVTVENGGLYLVSSGGTAHKSLLKSGGTQIVYADVMAASVTVEDGGVLHVSSGGYVRNPVVSLGGIAHAWANALFDGARISGLVEVDSNAAANSASVLEGGTLAVLTGGYVYEPKVSPGGMLDIASGGRANFAKVFEDGAVVVSAGASCNNAEINGGRITLAGAIAPADPETEAVPGGFASNTTVNSGGSFYISSGALASNTTVNTDGSFVIYKGATANRIKENGGYVDVKNGADVSFESNVYSGLTVRKATVHSGTTANGTTVNSRGSMYIFSGGMANDTTINYLGVINVSHGGVANNTTVFSGGTVNISSGGMANNTTINPFCFLSVFSGGTATDIVWTPCEGHISVEGGGYATYASQYSGIYYGNNNHLLSNVAILESRSFPSSYEVYVLTDGVTNRITIPGEITIAFGGIANDTINSGNMHISSGGIANNTINSRNINISFGGIANDTVNLSSMSVFFGGTAKKAINSGNMHISSGGIANDTVNYTDMKISMGGLANDTINSGSMQVSSGGIVSNTIVNSGNVVVSFGGTADSTTINAKAYMNVSGKANITTVNAKGSCSILSRGIADNTTVNIGGSLSVSSRGTANHVLINIGGQITVGSGGTANEIVENGGNVIIANGAQATFAANTFSGLELSNAIATVHSRTVANSTKIISNGTLFIYNGGLADNSLVSNNGIIRIFSGGIADNTIVSGGSLFVSDGGTTNKTIVAGGTFSILSGGIAKDIFESGGYVSVEEGADVTFANNTLSGMTIAGKTTIHSGTVAQDVKVSSLGQMYLFSSGIANNTTVYAEGKLFVSSGGIADDMKVYAGGTLKIGRNGIMTGKMSFLAGAVVSVEDGAIMDFNLTKTTADNKALLNDWSLIQGTPTYTLTLSAEQAKGVYTLAEGAAEFNSTITVQNTLGETLGTLTVGGETVFVGDTGYTLNRTGSSLTVTVEEPAPSVPANLVGTKDRVSWDAAGAGGYVIEYSTDDFAHVLRADTTGTAVDMLDLPAGTYQWRVRTDDGEDWAVGDAIVSDNDTTPKVLQSNADGSDDIFFAKADGSWEGLYYAQHVGSVNDWSGTNEVIFMNGKNRLADLFFGSDDANILCLTDDENGDGIFVDDEYTELPEGITEQQARIARIDEIRAGAGDDIVDMTSCRIEYTGDGLTIHGGDGDDVVWANKGDNLLFGDAGNDRIVGASGNDVIAGGIGNDRMHGGGGDDVFTFCENFGMDEVQQLETGTVTLWFAEGSIDNWDEASQTYTDGENSVTVRGDAPVSLKFGGTDEQDAAQFAALSGLGAFDAFTSRRVFEESGEGILAGR